MYPELLAWCLTRVFGSLFVLDVAPPGCPIQCSIQTAVPSFGSLTLLLRHLVQILSVTSQTTLSHYLPHTLFARFPRINCTCPRLPSATHLHSLRALRKRRVHAIGCFLESYLLFHTPGSGRLGSSIPSPACCTDQINIESSHHPFVLISPTTSEPGHDVNTSRVVEGKKYDDALLKYRVSRTFSPFSSPSIDDFSNWIASLDSLLKSETHSFNIDEIQLWPIRIHHHLDQR